jgi:uncharacterized delta-60 repeat protein
MSPISTELLNQHRKLESNYRRVVREHSETSHGIAERYSSFCLATLLCVFILFLCGVGSAQSPMADDSFSPSASDLVTAFALQPDGRIVVSGVFGTINNQPRNCIARLYPDGTLESGFNPGANATIYSLAIQPDGKILLGGDFTTIGGQSRLYIGRVNNNGTLDTGFKTSVFNPPPLQTLTARVQAMALQPDGKILIAGKSIKNGQTGGYVLRLNTNGVSDVGFTQAGGPNAPVVTLALQPDEKILVGGRFTSLGGKIHNFLGRLNLDGTVDTNFNPVIQNNFTNVVLTIAVQADGKILFGGSFDNVEGQPRSNIARLNTDGTLDTSFNPGVQGSTVPTVNSLVVQADGKIVVGGSFSVVAGQTRTNLARLNMDGTLDTGFDPGANSQVFGLALDADGKILVGGNFTSLACQKHTFIGRLNPTEPSTQELSFDGSTITWSRGGTGAECWRTTFEVSADGSSWSWLGAGIRDSGVWKLAGLALPIDNRVRARGYATGGDFNSASWFVETISGPCFFDIQPIDQTNNAGTPAGLWAHAQGTPPLSYQWLRNGTLLLDTGPISGATTPTLSFENVFGANAGAYAVVVSNSFGSITSLVANLVIHDPVIVSKGSIVTTNAGVSVEFKITAQGTTPLSYRWFKDGLMLQEGGNAFGVGDPTLTVTNVTAKDSGLYAVAVSNSVSIVTNLAAYLDVIDPVIVNQPLDQELFPGQSADFQIISAGSAPLAYQWRKNGINLEGETKGTLTITNLQCQDGGGFDVVISNSIGVVTSTVAYLTIDGNLTAPDAWNPGADYGVLSLAMQMDRGVFVAGGFTQLGGLPHQNLGLLNTDGTLNTNFNPSVNGNCILVQSNGKLVLGGGSLLTRLNPDGSTEPVSFPVPSSATYRPGILCMASPADGKILVGGIFDKLGDQPRRYIGLLNQDGTLDTTFDPGGDWFVWCLAIQSDGKILFNGDGRVVRVTSDGTVDAGFTPTITGGGVYAMAVQSDGKIIIGGSFTNICGEARNYIGRLNSDGSLDRGFNPGASDMVSSLALQCDGRILVSGYFTNLSGQFCKFIGRLNVDGSLDCTFKPQVAGNSFPMVRSMIVQPDGEVLLGGNFGSLGGQPRSGLGRLTNTDPATERLSFDGFSLTWLRGGTSPEVYRTTFEFSTNSTDWDLLGNGTRTPAGWSLAGVSLPANATIRARGFVQSSSCYFGDATSSSWFVETTLQVTPRPLILVNDAAFGMHSNQFGFNVIAVAGAVVVVEASEDLSHWNPIVTNRFDTSMFYFADPLATTIPRRFYRARLQ